MIETKENQVLTRRSSSNIYLKAKAEYGRYLETYKNLNKGSIKGATRFADFYIIKFFVGSSSSIKRPFSMDAR